MELTIPAAARLIGRNPETVRRWIRSGRLRACKHGTQYFVRAADLPGGLDAVELPEWLKTTDAGDPMPDIVSYVRRQREGH